MPLKPEIIQAYAGSKRYARIVGFYTSSYYEKYKQFFGQCSSKQREYVIFSYLLCVKMCVVALNTLSARGKI